MYNFPLGTQSLIVEMLSRWKIRLSYGAKKEVGVKSCVGVYFLELVKLPLQYKRGTIFLSEWFWRMEELTKRNDKEIWL